MPALREASVVVGAVWAVLVVSAAAVAAAFCAVAASLVVAAAPEALGVAMVLPISRVTHLRRRRAVAAGG
jgi:hypothetical protein